MADFDPTAYADAVGGGFDPAAYADSVGRQLEPATADGQPSIQESIARGLGHGYTLGFGDKIGGGEAEIMQAAANQMPQWLLDKVGLVKASPVDAYWSVHDQDRQNNEAAQAANPWAYGLSDLVGGGVSGFAVPAASLKGLTNLQKLAALAKTTGLVGGLAAVGAGDNLSSPVRSLGDFLIGEATGTALPFVGNRAVEAATPTLRSIANSKAVEALGTKLGQYRDLAGAFLDPAVLKANTQRIGKLLLDRGLIPWLGDADSIAGGIAPELTKEGSLIGNTIADLDKAGATRLEAAVKNALPSTTQSTARTGESIPVSEIGLHKSNPRLWAMEPENLPGGAQKLLKPSDATAPGRAASAAASVGKSDLPETYISLPDVRAKARQEVLAPLQKLAKIARGNVPKTISDEIDGIANASDRMSLGEMQDNLQALDSRLGDVWNEHGGQTTEAMKQIRGVMRQAQQAIAEKIDPAKAATLAQAKQNFGDLSDALGISSDAMLRKLSNRDIAPSDYATGLAAMISGHPAGAVVAGLAHRGLRQGGNALTSRTTNGLANLLEGRALPRISTAVSSTAAPSRMRSLLDLVYSQQ